jgi:hypothetical protein
MSKLYETNSVDPYSSRAFLWYQEPEKRCHGLGDLNATNKQNKQGVCHTVALPFYIKKCLKAKEELWKLKYFTMQKSKRNQNPSTYYNSIITNLKFQHKPKYHRSKILI